MSQLFDMWDSGISFEQSGYNNQIGKPLSNSGGLGTP